MKNFEVLIKNKEIMKKISFLANEIDKCGNYRCCHH